MNTKDLFKIDKSARRINESIEKMFGKKINFESFSLEQLQDARNKIRTQLSQQRASSGFNENVENEAYYKAQWMLDAINAEITHREEYIMDSVEVSVNEGEIHDEADHWTQEFIKMGMDPKEAEDKAWDLLWRRRKREVGIDDDDDIDEGKIGDMVKDGSRSMKSESSDYMNDLVKFAKVVQSAQNPEQLKTAKKMGQNLLRKYRDVPAGKLDQIGKTLGHDISWQPGRENDVEDELERKGREFKETIDPADRGEYDRESEFRENQQRNTTMKKIYESEVDQASAIVTANTMVDRLGRWIEELSGMENETLLDLGDSIRDEMGQEQSRQFIEAVAPGIQSALETLKTARETVSGAVRSLATGESPDAMLGAPEEPEMDGDTDMDMSDPDAMNADDIEIGPEEPADDFDAAEPAAGGIETAGREKRESINFQNRLLKVLAG
jgi:hypothetical protein